MPAVQRKGDLNDASAAITAGVDSVRINNKAVSVNGSPVADHAKHKGVKTANGVASVKANNTPINVKGNADTCGHSRVGGSPDVKVG